MIAKVTFFVEAMECDWRAESLLVTLCNGLSVIVLEQVSKVDLQNSSQISSLGSIHNPMAGLGLFDLFIILKICEFWRVKKKASLYHLHK